MNMARTLFVSVAFAAVAGVAVAQQRISDLTGVWTYSVVTENGTGTPTVTLKQKGDSLSGTYESSRMGALALAGKVKGNEFSFDVLTEGGTTITFDGAIVDSTHVKGSVAYNGEPGASFTGERKK